MLYATSLRELHQLIANPRINVLDLFKIDTLSYSIIYLNLVISSSVRTTFNKRTSRTHRLQNAAITLGCPLIVWNLFTNQYILKPNIVV